MNEYRKHEIFSGLFIVAAVIVFCLFAFKVGNLDPFAGKTLKCEAYAANVGSLDVGSQVMTGGRRVGAVTEIHLVPASELKSHAVDGKIRPMLKISFEIDDPNLAINPKLAELTLARDGLLGGQFISLNPGYWPADQPPADTDQSNLKEPVLFRVRKVPGIAEIIAEAGPVIENVNGLILDLRKATTNINDNVLSDDKTKGLLSIVANLNEAIDIGESFLVRMDKMVQKDNPDGLSQQVIKPLGKLITDANKDLDEITDVIKDTTLVSLNKILTDGEAGIADANKALLAFKDMAESGNPKVQAILDDLSVTSKNLDGHLETITENANKLLKNLDGVVSDNSPDLRETTRRLRRASWQAEMALRKIRANPAVLLVGDKETDFQAERTDQTILRNQGRANPYGQRDEGDKP
jgi:ABC-type transporter Mla subunit MlaD